MKEILRKALMLFLFCLFVFLFMILAVTACQAEEQALKEAGADTIAYLTSVETEKHIAADKAELAETEETEDVTQDVSEEPVIKLYYDVPLDYDLQDYIIHLCEEHHIDPAVVIAMIECESNFQADAIGDGGNSEGLMQIQSYYHAERMDRLGCTNLFDPFQNVTVGIDILAELIDYYEGNVEMALMAYNAGCSGAYEYWFSKGVYSNEYSRAVLATCQELKDSL